MTSFLFGGGRSKALSYMCDRLPNLGDSPEIVQRVQGVRLLCDWGMVSVNVIVMGNALDANAQ